MQPGEPPALAYDLEGSGYGFRIERYMSLEASRAADQLPHGAPAILKLALRHGPASLRRKA